MPIVSPHRWDQSKQLEKINAHNAQAWKASYTSLSRLLYVSLLNLMRYYRASS